MMPCGLYGAMLGIWHHSPYLQRRFPLQLEKRDDCWRFVAWCSAVGIRNRKILREIPEWSQDLGEHVSLPHSGEELWKGGYSMKMYLLALHRAGGDIQAVHRDAGLRHQIGVDYWRGERHRLHAPPLQSWQLEWLHNRFGTPEQLAETLRIRRIDGDRAVGDLMQDFGMEDLIQTWGDPSPGVLAQHLSRRVHAPTYPRRWEYALRRGKSLVLPWMMGKRPSEGELAAVMGMVSRAKQTLRIHHPFGVNLFGYARGELGIGEDVRMTARALESNGIPFCIVNIGLGKHISQQDHFAEKWISPVPRYGINLFCQTGIEMVRYANTEGMEAFEGRYTIGMWPWELPEWPESCRHSYALVDEIWGFSRYTADSYHSFGRAVTPMSLPVEVTDIASRDRKDFGLPVQPYLFHFSFDIHSRICRKNPLGIIRAFQKAFPKESHHEVGLVIKVNHPETFSLVWKKISLLARLDTRIHIIARRMRRPEVLALMKSCDCYVSLHRAEGFGRGIAEALLLGKQVITTGWSGNTDFCHEPRVALVRHKMVSVRRGDYFHGEGQQWADPDLDHAAELMREIRKNPRDVAVGQPDFSPATVGARYAERLKEIWENVAQSGTDPEGCQLSWKAGRMGALVDLTDKDA